MSAIPVPGAQCRRRVPTRGDSSTLVPSPARISVASLSGRMTFPPPTFTPEGPRGVELGAEPGEGGEVRSFQYLVQRFAQQE